MNPNLISQTYLVIQPQLNSTQTKGEVSVIPSYPSHPPTQPGKL